MKRYKNRSGNSGVSYYDIGEDYIDIRFKNTLAIFRYSYEIAGELHVEKMKRLAVYGKGLSTYISQHPAVKNNYEKV